MKTLFDSERSALADSLRRTAETLSEYAERYDHWAIAFSGGKRDQAIAVACSRDGAECGQGWMHSLADGVNNINRYFVPSSDDGITDTLAPILHWRTCHVWDWLALHAPKDGFDTRPVATVYDQDVEGSANEISARTGCVGCPLASRDTALDRVLRRSEWAYLAPMKRLKPLYVELTKHKNRIRKDGSERRMDGTLVKNPGRVGPLKLEARRWGLQQVLTIQEEINRAAVERGRPEYLLIDLEERARILELIAANTWPDRWTGDEPSGDSAIPDYYADGTMQDFLFGE